jgi:nucleoside-diphosphate-sugar epimerase
MKKKVLIFGASSFLAQNYIKFDDNNKLFCINKSKKVGLIKKNNAKYKVVKNLSVRSIKSLVIENEIDIIINFISNNNNKFDRKNDNIKIFKDNILPSLKIVEAMKNQTIKYIYFDSHEVNKKKNTIYKLSKKMLSQLNEYFKKKYKIKIIKISLPTVLGKYDRNNKRLLPLISKNKKLLFPDQSVNFSFADDVVASIRRHVNDTKKIKIKLYKKKANYFINQYQKLRKKEKNDSGLVGAKVNDILLFYKNF